MLIVSYKESIPHLKENIDLLVGRHCYEYPKKYPDMNKSLIMLIKIVNNNNFLTINVNKITIIKTSFINNREENCQ